MRFMCHNYADMVVISIFLDVEIEAQEDQQICIRSQYRLNGRTGPSE